MSSDKTILVFGATGQQGGGTARALRDAGWRVRAIVRDPTSKQARALEGVELVRGDFRDSASIASAMRGVHGVFSIQPSSGQPEAGVTDADEVRFGTEIADAAERAGVQHLVYTSIIDAKPNTGVSHFETKWQIEEHIRHSDIPYTIVRPAGFMELLVGPLFGVPQHHLQFFTAPDQPVQIIAADDIGRLVARIFADRPRHLGKVVELAGDELTCHQIVEKLGHATNTKISYSPFPEDTLNAVPMLRALSNLLKDGGYAPVADIAALRRLEPRLLTFDAWLAKGGADLARATMVSQ